MKKWFRQISLPKLAGVLAFLLPLVIMLVIFVGRGIWPFGDRSFLVSDMYHQYMPFFAEFLRSIKAGEGLDFTWRVGIGSNFLALYVYYLASPLHWLAFLLPEKYLMDFMSYLAIVKIGLCGLTSFIYLQRREEGVKDGGAVLFSLFYALSGFMAAYNYNIMWLDCIILLPLILLGLERLVKQGRCTLYCLTLALSIFTNYYISIMICIFLVCYFLALVLKQKPRLHTFLQFAFYSLLAAGMASVLLIPEVCAILATDFGEISFPKSLESYFSVLDILARHCMGVATERGLDHWPNIYCGAAVFVLLPLYVTNQKIPVRERFGMLALQGILLLSFGTNVLNFCWHGLNYPDSLPARQSFIYILLVLTMCYRAFCYIRETETAHILYAYLGAVGFLLFVEKFVEHEDFMVWTAVWNLVFVTIYAILLYLYRTRKKETTLFVLAAVALVTVIVESSINTIITSVGTTGRSAYLASVEEYQALEPVLRDRGEDFYRLEKFSRKTKNDGTLAGYPSASVFSSTLNSDVMELYKELGMRYSKVFYCFDGATAFTSALLNVNYMLGPNEEYENSLYTLLSHRGDTYLYHCEATLPFGYVAPLGYDLPEGEIHDAVRLQNQMVRDLGVEENLFTKVYGDSQGDDVSLTALTEGIYYGVVDGSGTKKLEAVGGNPAEQKYSDLKNGSILYLGYLEKGERILLSNGDEEDETQKISVKFYRMDETVLKEALEALGRRHMTLTKRESSSVAGEIFLEEPGRLILSIPAEKGWTVYVNGERTEPDLFGGALMALDLEPGDYRISMRYVPRGKEAGLLVSIGSILLSIGLMILRKRR
ncbi:MAG: YfhO family protein [Roseburia sp.]|nr:YfhO family protein [Roseburia sp.]